jgi:hypothetical protein
MSCNLPFSNDTGNRAALRAAMVEFGTKVGRCTVSA